MVLPNLWKSTSNFYKILYDITVPAVLEHEAIAGLTASKPSGMRGRSSSTAGELEDKELSLDSLMKSVSINYKVIPLVNI